MTRKSEGRACRGHRSGVDNPSFCRGPDKRIPPKAKSEGHVYRAHSEGHACHARGSGVDYQTWCNGPDKRIPPKAKSEGHACHARQIGMDY
jgi:hypothetical protein